jgi:hypothetical protein
MRYVWTLSWFNAQGEQVVGEKTFETLSDELVAEILGVPVGEILSGNGP